MKIEIQGSGIEIDQNLRQLIEHRVGNALRARADHIDSVLVYLSDFSAPDDAADKRCLVQVRLHGIPDVRVEHSDRNLNVAIHRATDRAGWTVARGILRQHRKLIAALLTESLVVDHREPERAA